MHMMMNTDADKVAGAKLNRRTARRVLGFARPYRGAIITFVVVIVLESVLALVPIYVLKRIIDVAIPEGNRGLLHALAGLALVAALFIAGLSFVERFYSSRIGEGLIYDLRVKLFDHVSAMPIAFFTRTQTGALMSRMNNDVIGAQRAVTTTLGSVVSNVIVLATTLTYMILLEWRITILALILLPIFVIPAKRVGRRLSSITREGFDLNSAMNTQMTERFNVSGALLVKLFGQGQRESKAFGDRAGRVRDIGIKSAMYSRTFMIALALVGSIGTVLVYWLGGQMVISGTITLGAMAAMAALVVRLYDPLTALSNARVDIMTALVSFDRVFEVLDLENPVVDRPGAVDLVDPVGRIEIDHVTFRYSSGAEVSLRSLEIGSSGAVDDGPGSEVLHDVSATIEAGQLVALVGPSGAGKTTLSSLIPRLYDVTEGALRVDGHDVRDLTLDSLRAAIGVVSQDPHLFHDSVAENLRFARPDASNVELVDGLQGRPDPRRDHGPPRRLRHRRRRARPPPLGRRAPAPRHRPHAGQGPCGRRARRGHEPPRLGERVARAAGPVHGALRPHGRGDRPPAVHHRRGRPDPRARRRAHRRAGPPRGPAGGRGPVRRALPHAGAWRRRRPRGHRPRRLRPGCWRGPVTGPIRLQGILRVR